MYKIGSFEEELMKSMESTLIKNEVESKTGYAKIAKAADLLNIAANIFDAADMIEEAEDITNVLASLSKVK